MAKHRKSVGRAKRCKRVATHGTKRAANKLAAKLKRNGFRPLVSKAYSRVGWAVFSCPPVTKRRKRRRTVK